MQTSVKEAFSSAEAVVEAEVLEIVPAEPRGWSELHLRPTRIWKPPGSRPTVVLAFDSNERPPLVVGKKYLMFVGKRGDGKLAIGKCSPLTKELELAGSEIEELSALSSQKTPTPIASSSGPESGVATAGHGYREIPGVCLPCGGESYVVIATKAELDRLTAALAGKCGEDRSPASWRERVEKTRVDFSKEAIVVLYEVIGTGGTSRLVVRGPDEGTLKAYVQWTTPSGPALPIATAACFSIAVEKSAVRRVEIRPGGVLNRATASGNLTLDIPR